MQFSTKVDIPKATFAIEPCERMLFVGSCFADNMGRRFVDDKFRAVVNPYGVMYNPASIMHTVRRYIADVAHSGAVACARTAVFTLGTNQRLFTERALSIEECEEYLAEAVEMLRDVNPSIRVVVTVSPIRYAKYGFHGSQLSKATLLLAADRLVKRHAAVDANGHPVVAYFPAYEIVNDELRDYRFYREDMLHPTDQAVEYIWERCAETFFSDETKRFRAEWRPVKAALAHRPFNPEGEEYKLFLQKTKEKADKLKERYPELEL